MHPVNIKMGQTITSDGAVNPIRGFIARLLYEAAAAKSAVAVLAETALTDAPQTIITNITDPDVVRNLTVKGNAGGIAGDVVIRGKNYANEDIEVTIALNGATEVLGLKAVKVVEEIDLPVETNVGTDTVSIGVGDSLGLPYILTNNTVLKTYLDNTLEGTEPTVIASANLENNTILLDSALDATNVDVYLIA